MGYMKCILLLPAFYIPKNLNNPGRNSILLLMIGGLCVLCSFFEKSAQKNGRSQKINHKLISIIILCLILSAFFFWDGDCFYFPRIKFISKSKKQDNFLSKY
jgi:peptidoglycan/LPS O-acetylase OafA/YrhL